MSKRGGMRKVKYVGEPPMVLQDEWRVANWQHENLRNIAYAGATECIMERTAIPGLSRDLVFTGATNFILELDPIDADLLLKASPINFVDVTDAADPEDVHHEPIIVYRDKTTGKFYKSRDVGPAQVRQA